MGIYITPLDRIRALQSENARLRQGAGIAFRALAQTDAITPEQALEQKHFFEPWEDWVGRRVPAKTYLVYEDDLYRVVQEHEVQAHYPPSTATAALYSRVPVPGEVPDWEPGSWALGVKVRHNGRIYQSMVDNNTWEPGSPGVYDNIWMEVPE